jgi:ADP-ribose pyrophosphatase YjhB (NUDIX family)
MNDYVKTMRQSIGTALIHLPGVRALLFNDQEEILLQKRTDMALWCLPAGAVELGETAWEALKREVTEETSLQIITAEPMTLYSGPNQRFRYPNGDEVQGFSVAFIVRKWQGQPRADGVEGSEVRFFPLTQLPDNLVPIHQHTIQDYENYNGSFIIS